MARIAAIIGCIVVGAFSLASGQERSRVLLSALGDCEKITKDGAVPASPHFWNPQTRTLRLHGGRNEMLGAQLMLTATVGDVKGVNVV